MFRFRISAQGPKIRSNRALSNLMHFRGPFAFTVAALGRSSNKAISPEIKHYKEITWKKALSNNLIQTRYNKAYINLGSHPWAQLVR